MKVWTRDGRILYSDEPALIGQRFGLGAEERELFDNGGADAELSDLTKPENRYERPAGKLLEAHTVDPHARRQPGAVRDLPALLVDQRRRAAAAAHARAAAARRRSPCCCSSRSRSRWRMARRLQRGHRDRERLLAAAVESSDRERGRIASDLHDGVVQDLAGVAFGLAPLADEAQRDGDARRAGVAPRRGRAAAPGRARPAHAARRDPPAATWSPPAWSRR